MKGECVAFIVMDIAKQMRLILMQLFFLFNMPALDVITLSQWVTVNKSEATEAEEV